MMDILYAGFDGLTINLSSDIPEDFASELACAKAHAKETHTECILEFGNIKLSVTEKGARGYTCHTGDTGAIWLIQDPSNPIPNNPMVVADFRALGLALDGLAGAENHFRDCMAAFGIPYTEAQIKVSRVDFAVDVLAPWFEPDRNALVVPSKTNVRELTSAEETETLSAANRVTGLRSGSVNNRQLVIYDKCLEVIQKGKKSWPTIWDQNRTNAGKPLLDLSDWRASRVWRFEMRMGSKQLRNRYEMRSWQDLREMVGDAYTEFFEKVRYCRPTEDSNCSRWPSHDIWALVRNTALDGLSQHCSGVVASDVIYANKLQK